MPTVNILTAMEEILIMKKDAGVIMHPANFSGLKKNRLIKHSKVPPRAENGQVRFKF